MSQTLSPSFARCYGLARVARAWKISRADDHVRRRWRARRRHRHDPAEGGAAAMTSTIFRHYRCGASTIKRIRRSTLNWPNSRARRCIEDQAGQHRRADRQVSPARLLHQGTGQGDTGSAASDPRQLSPVHDAGRSPLWREPPRHHPAQEHHRRARRQDADHAEGLDEGTPAPDRVRHRTGRLQDRSDYRDQDGPPAQEQRSCDVGRCADRAISRATPTAPWRGSQWS